MFVSEFESCVFQIHAKQSYHQQLRLLEPEIRKGRGSDGPKQEQNDPDVVVGKSIKQLAKEERVRNRQIVALNQGRPLRFSDSFQLLHIKSKKFLKAIFENAADVEGNRVQVVLSETASCFRMKSMFSQKHAGEPVNDLEAVLILPEGLVGATLNYIPQPACARWVRGECEMFEASICSADRDVGWLVQHYARDSQTTSSPPGANWASTTAAAAVAEDDSEEASRAPLRCGQVVRLLHAQQNAYIATMPNLSIDTLEASCSLVILEPRADAALGVGSETTAGRLRTAKGVAAVAQPSVYTLWLVENMDATRGAPLRFGLAIRLRSVATGTYLVLKREGLVASYAALRPAEMSQSLFAFRRPPELRGEDDAVVAQALVWLGYCGDDHSGCCVRAKLREGTAEPELVLAPGLPETDGLVIDPVYADYVTAVTNIVSAREALVRFVRDSREAWEAWESLIDARNTPGSREARKASAAQLALDPPHLDWVEVQSVICTIERLCSFVGRAHKEDLSDAQQPGAVCDLKFDPYHSSGCSDTLLFRQALLRELNILDVLVCYITNVAVWDKILDYALSSESNYMGWSKMRTAGLKLLILALSENAENGFHLVQYLEVMLNDLARENSDPLFTPSDSISEISLCDVIIRIYEKNDLALQTVNDKTADLFLSALKGQRQLRPKLLQMLSAIVDHRGEETSHDKIKICSKFLDNCFIFPETRKRDNVTLVKMPCMSKNGSVWREISEVMNDNLDREYYVQYIKLLACFLHGRSRSVDNNRFRFSQAGLLSFDLCFSCVKSEELSPSIRTAYCRLVIDVFIDAPPQEEKQLCDDLQIWSEIYREPLRTNEPLENILEIKAFALQFLEVHGVQGQNSEMDNFTISVLELVENLIRFGFYNQTASEVFTSPEIRNFPQYKERYDAFCNCLANDGKSTEGVYEFELLVMPLMYILDPSTDQVSDLSSMLVQNTKICCCRIFDLLCDMVLILRLKTLLRVYDSDLVNGLVPSLELFSNESLEFGAPRPEFEDVLKKTCSLKRMALTSSLSELLKFNNTNLDHFAMRLVLRLNGQRSFLLNRLFRTELLVNEAVVHLYREHRALLQNLDELIITLVTLQRQRMGVKQQVLEAERMKRLQEEIEKDRIDAAAAAVEHNDSPVARSANGIHVFRNVFDNVRSKFFSLRGHLKTNDDSRQEFKEMAEDLQQSRHIFNWKSTKTRKFDRAASNKSLKIDVFHELSEIQADYIDGNASFLRDCVHNLKKSVQKILSDCPFDRDHPSLLSLQTQFRQLKVHTKMVNILTALFQDGKFPDSEDSHLVGLAQNCCLLCANFCYKNVKNAYLLYPHLDLFMLYLNDGTGLRVNADEVVFNMFNDNRLLCTQTAHAIENKIIASIGCLGHKYAFLRLLSALLCPRGVPIQQNQIRIAKTLNVQKEKILALYDGGTGLKILKRYHVEFHEKRRRELHSFRDRSSQEFAGSMLRLDSVSAFHSLESGTVSQQTSKFPEFDPDCKVMYYCQTIKLFAKLAAGSSFSCSDF